MTLLHAFTNQILDGTATSIVRPSDWNSAHVQAMTLSGNTAGQSSFSGTNIIFQGGNNVTLSASTALNAATLIISGPSLAAYLTTAMQSNAGSDFLYTSQSSLLQHTSATSAITSNAFPTANSTNLLGSGYTTHTHTYAGSNHSHGVTLNLTNINGTTGGNSAGINLSLSAVVPAQTIQTQGSVAVNGSTGGLSLVAASSLSISQNASTISFGLASNITTALQSAGAYLTTAMLSAMTSNYMSTAERGNYFGTAGNTFANMTHSHGNPTLNLTNLAGTTASNSAGFTISLSASTYLTTAMQSQMTSNYMSTAERGNYFGTAGNTFANMTHSHGNPTLNLTNISGTTASNSGGLTISLSANVGGAGDGYNIIGVNGNTVGSAATVNLSNSNNVSFGLNGSTITASASFAAQTVDTNKAGTGFTSAGNNIGISATQNTNGLSFSATVPAQSAFVLSNSNGVTFGTNASTVTASVVTNYAVSNITTNNIATANSSLFQHTTATSAITANAFPTANTTNLVAIANSSLFQHTTATSAIVSDRAYSTHSHGNPILNLTNISGTTASASNGLTISLSANVGGAGDGGVAISAGAASQSTGTIIISNSNGMSFGLNAGTLTASHNGLTTAMLSAMTSNYMSTAERNNYFFTSNNTLANSTHSHGNPILNLTNISGTTASNSAGFTMSLSVADPGGGAAINVSAGTTSGNVQTLVFSNLNGVSFGLNGSTLTASAAAGGAVLNRNMIEIIPGERLTTIANLSASQWSQRPIFVPFWMDGQNLIPKTIRFLVSGAGSSNRSLVATFAVALYSKVNDTQLTIFGSDTMTFSYTNSSQSSAWNGVRLMDFTGMSSLTMTQEGRWVLGFHFSATSYNATYANVVMYGADPMPSLAGYFIGNTTSATNASSNVFPFWGIYSTTSAGFPGTVNMTQIHGGNSASLLDPYGIIKEV